MWIDKNISEIPLPEEVLIMNVVRNNKISYIFHDQFKFKENDVVYLSFNEMKEKDIEILFNTISEAEIRDEKKE